MKRFINRALGGLVSGALAVGLLAASPAFAQMPETDVALMEQMADASTDDKLEALGVYYDLKVSELDVQLKHEENTGAFFGIRNAERDGGDVLDAEQRARETRAAWDKARADNVALRQELNLITGIDFPGKFSIMPDAPMNKPAALSGTPGELEAERDQAWARLEQARANLGDMRMALLEAQQQYDETRDVPIGDVMRDMTRAEIKAARAAADYRLVEARAAAAAGKPIAAHLAGL